MGDRFVIYKRLKDDKYYLESFRDFKEIVFYNGGRELYEIIEEKFCRSKKEYLKYDKYFNNKYS